MTPARQNEKPVRGNLTGTFIEADCEVGGCACPIWSDWYWSAVENAQKHPSAADFEMLRRHGLISDDDASEHDHRIAELMIADGTHVHLAPACQRSSCARSPKIEPRPDAEKRGEA